MRFSFFLFFYFFVSRIMSRRCLHTCESLVVNEHVLNLPTWFLLLPCNDHARAVEIVTDVQRFFSKLGSLILNARGVKFISYLFRYETFSFEFILKRIYYYLQKFTYIPFKIIRKENDLKMICDRYITTKIREKETYNYTVIDDRLGNNFC